MTLDQNESSLNWFAWKWLLAQWGSRGAMIKLSLSYQIRPTIINAFGFFTSKQHQSSSFEQLIARDLREFD